MNKMNIVNNNINYNCNNNPNNFNNFNNLNIFNNLNNYNIQKSLISLINSSILVNNKHQHPLLYCYINRNIENFWNCHNCHCNNPRDIPSFYCTICNFDLCQNCLMQCNMFEITLFDYNTPESKMLIKSMNGKYQNNPWHLKLPCHIHPLTLIKKVNQNKNNEWMCKCCKFLFKNDQPFLYCSLCDYYLCQKCGKSIPQYFCSDNL